MLKRTVFVLGVISLAWVITGICRFFILSSRGGELIAAAKPYQRKGDSAKKILVLGDSLAFGTGASSPEHSLAGEVAAKYPGASVENRSRNGKRTNELAGEMADVKDHYALILIVIGGNDIMRPWINLDDSAKNLQTIYSAASQHADTVIAFSTGNMKTTTFFPWPLNQYIGHRSVILRNTAKQVAGQLPNVHYMDMVSYNEQVPFTGEFEAPDHLHLNDAGVRYWIDALKAQKLL